MHITDGALSLPVVGVTAVVAGAGLVYSLKGASTDDIPRLSLLSAAFFMFSMISVPVGPTSVHPLLGGLMGIMLRRQAPIAIFVGLLLQALLFNHGGITTLGANLLMVAIPAFLAGQLFYSLERLPVFFRAAFSGGLAVIGCVALLILLLLFSDQMYGAGAFSVVNILIMGYTPLVIVEAMLTGFAVNFLYRTRPGLLGLINKTAD